MESCNGTVVFDGPANRRWDDIVGLGGCGEARVCGTRFNAQHRLGLLVSLQGPTWVRCCDFSSEILVLQQAVQGAWFDPAEQSGVLPRQLAEVAAVDIVPPPWPALDWPDDLGKSPNPVPWHATVDSGDGGNVTGSEPVPARNGNTMAPLLEPIYQRGRGTARVSVGGGPAVPGSRQAAARDCAGDGVKVIQFGLGPGARHHLQQSETASGRSAVTNPYRAWAAVPTPYRTDSTAAAATAIGTTVRIAALRSRGFRIRARPVRGVGIAF